MINEFKKFISRGNVIDLAVGVIIGAAFGKIVSSLVDDIIMPLLGIIVGKNSFTDLTLKVGEATIKYGNFIQNIVDFLIVSLCIFFLVKFVNKLTSLKKKEEVKEAPAKKSDETILLTEIRDLLKKESKKK